MSEDIAATLNCLAALGIKGRAVTSKMPGRAAIELAGGRPAAVGLPSDCGESGSTLRFLLPLGALCGSPVTFVGRGQLVKRPLQPYYDIFESQGLDYLTAADGGLPVTVNGVLRPGVYELPGNVSSQFVSGLLFALPLLPQRSELVITTPLESRSYVEMTLSCLHKYGIEVWHDDYQRFVIPGAQSYMPGNYSVEGDWSQAAFWLTAGALGADLTCCGVSKASLQGDREIVAILRRMGAEITETPEGNWLVRKSRLRATVIDATDCPDIIPVLTVAAAVAEGVTEIVNAGRLRIKESDRLAAISSQLNRLGAKVQELPEGLRIFGQPQGLSGGCADSCNDHRIAMSLAVAALVCHEPVSIGGAEAVKKSYPQFWQDFIALGGNIELSE